MAEKDNDELNVDPEESGEEVDNDPIPDYDDMVRMEPAREVKLDEYVPPTKGIDEEEEDTSHLSDKQAAMKYLYAKYEDPYFNRLAKSTIFSRIFPDNLVDRSNLVAASKMLSDWWKPNFDPVFIVLASQDIHLKAYEGRAIADMLDLMGAENGDDIEKLSKQLGLG